MRLSAHCTLRAVKDGYEATHTGAQAEALADLARELQAYLAVAGWEFDLILIRESQCSFRGADSGRCPERAETIVGGSDFCLRHASGARRLMADLANGGRAA